MKAAGASIEKPVCEYRTHPAGATGGTPYYDLLVTAASGPQGPQGFSIHGEDGDEGEQGWPGAMGVQGYQGASGASGVPGTPGGASGASGATGATGATGASGTPGGVGGNGNYTEPSFTSPPAPGSWTTNYLPSQTGGSGYQQTRGDQTSLVLVQGARAR